VLTRAFGSRLRVLLMLLSPLCMTRTGASYVVVDTRCTLDDRLAWGSWVVKSAWALSVAGLEQVRLVQER